MKFRSKKEDIPDEILHIWSKLIAEKAINENKCAKVRWKMLFISSESSSNSRFVNIAYSRQKGHSIGVRYGTVADLLTMTVGVHGWLHPSRYSWCHFYSGLGVGSCYLHLQNNDSPYVPKYENKWGGATLAQIGSRFDIWKQFFVDAYVDYRFNWFKFNKNYHSSLVGGLGFGGLGVRF